MKECYEKDVLSLMIERFSIDEVENTLRQIDGVKAARIVVGLDQGIEEIHVVANVSKGPKQLSRDIESLLMAKYGLPVNHRKISIAQINSRDVKRGGFRFKLASIQHKVFGNNAMVSIVLEYNGNAYEGTEEGPASKVGRLRLVASATLRAIEKALPDTYNFALEDITATYLGRDLVVIVSVAVLSLGIEENHVGCSFIRGDERKAIVGAVLDAVNRRLELLMTA